MSGKPTHYDVLGVSKYATYEEIKESFHRLARAKHPDKQSRHNPQQTNRENDSDDCVDGNDNNQIGFDQTAAEFRRIHQAWQILRDEDERSVYDSELLQKDLHEENRRNGALVLKYQDDLEEAIDEETNERFMVYDCRCGEEIHIDVSPLEVSASGEFLVDCPGCCFVYRIIGK